MEQLNVKTGTPVVLVSGENYPDALAISSIAAQNQFPILLVQNDGISEVVSQVIAAIKPSKIYFIGLEEAISPAAERPWSENLKKSTSKIHSKSNKPTRFTSCGFVAFNLFFFSYYRCILLKGW